MSKLTGLQPFAGFEARSQRHNWLGDYNAHSLMSHQEKEGKSDIIHSMLEFRR